MPRWARARASNSAAPASVRGRLVMAKAVSMLSLLAMIRCRVIRQTWARPGHAARCRARLSFGRLEAAGFDTAVALIRRFGDVEIGRRRPWFTGGNRAGRPGRCRSAEPVDCL